MTQVISPVDWHAELTVRRAQVWSIAAEMNCDAVLVYGCEGHMEPFRYLTNFVPVMGDGWGVLSGADALACVLNFDWQIIEARRKSGVADWYGHFDTVPVLADLLGSPHLQRVGVAGLHRLPAAVYEALRRVRPKIDWIDIGATVTALRRIKSPLEIQLLREAGRITDAAFDAIRAEIQPGLTEHDVAARLDYAMKRMGAGLSFPTTVISGNDDPIMIRMPIDRTLQAGDTVMIDIGAMFEGYQADASRTFVLGQPSVVQRRVWQTIQDSYQAALDQVRPGVPCHATHVAALQVIESAGYALIHRVGHGIGLATSFEWPSLISETAPFQPGMTFCLEPGIYVPGAGNMKLEDDFVVTESGCERLTHSSHDLMIPL